MGSLAAIHLMHKESYMGAYLFFKAKNPEQVDEINEFLENIDINKELEVFDSEIFLRDQDTVKYYIDKIFYDKDVANKMLGTAEVKTSGLDCDEESIILELLTKLFERINCKYRMQYSVRSCSLCINESYFSASQIKRFTNNGKLLSYNKIDRYAVKKYYQLLELIAGEILPDHENKT